MAISRELPPDVSAFGEVPSTPTASAPPSAEAPRAARTTGSKLVLDHFDFIWRVLRRFGLSPEDADDAAQQVFMTATQKLDLIATGNERTFLYGVARRVTANLKRKAYRRREGAPAELADLEDEHATADLATELHAARALLDEILATLPEELRRVLVLASIEQLEVHEIASAEGIPTGTAASRLRRARALFKEKLDTVRHRLPFGPT